MVIKIEMHVRQGKARNWVGEMRNGWARSYLYGCGDWAPVVFWPVVVSWATH